MEQQVYVDRGKQLTEVGIIADAETYPSALALLSIHASIAFNDAVLFRLTGFVGNSQNHQDAARRTEKACKSKKLDHSGVRHLTKLLAAKTDVSYGSRRTTGQQAQALANAARSFRAWAYKTLQPQRQE